MQLQYKFQLLNPQLRVSIILSGYFLEKSIKVKNTLKISNTLTNYKSMRITVHSLLHCFINTSFVCFKHLIEGPLYLGGRLYTKFYSIFNFVVYFIVKIIVNCFVSSIGSSFPIIDVFFISISAEKSSPGPMFFISVLLSKKTGELVSLTKFITSFDCF